MASLKESANSDILSPKTPQVTLMMKDVKAIERPKNPPPPDDESNAEMDKVDDSEKKNTPTKSSSQDQERVDTPQDSSIVRVVDPVFTHKVYEYFHPNESRGYMYTVGLHALGFPELVALNLPRHRSWIVKKNMDFLALKMLQGVPVLHGHRSTDYNYRVNLLEITEQHERLRLISARLLHVHPKARILNLVPFYQDAEDWGSFPPTPDGQSLQRDKILSVLLFPQVSGVNGLALYPNDIKYFLAHKTHFQRILMCPDTQTILAMLHPYCQWNAMPRPTIPSSASCLFSPRSTFSTPPLPYFHSQGTPIINNTSSLKKKKNTDTKKLAVKVSTNSKMKRKTPPRSKKWKSPMTTRTSSRACSPNSDKENLPNGGQVVARAEGHRGKELRSTTEVNSMLI